MYVWSDGEYHVEPEWFYDKRVSQEMVLQHKIVELYAEKYHFSRKHTLLRWFDEYGKLGILLEIRDLPF